MAGIYIVAQSGTSVTGYNGVRFIMLFTHALYAQVCHVLV